MTQHYTLFENIEGFARNVKQILLEQARRKGEVSPETTIWTFYKDEELQDFLAQAVVKLEQEIAVFQKDKS